MATLQPSLQEQEYWIVDYRPNRRRADFFRPDREGRFQRVTIGDDGIYRSAVLPGFWVKVAWLMADELDWLAALREMLGPERLAEAMRAEG